MRPNLSTFSDVTLHNALIGLEILEHTADLKKCSEKDILKYLPYPNEGICLNLFSVSMSYKSFAVDLVSICSTTWDKSSGDIDYPIRVLSDNTITPAHEYHNCVNNGTLWKGQYRVQRLSLIRHMIAVIKEELEVRKYKEQILITYFE